MLNVTLYFRKDDPASERVRNFLQGLQSKFPHRLAELDVDSDPALKKKYGEQVPVVEAGPYHMQAPITEQNLQMTIGAAYDRNLQMKKIDEESFAANQQRTRVFDFGDRLSFWISRHYLAALNIFMLIYFGLPLLAPVFMRVGWTSPATIIYKVYSPLCHQFGFRSFFLFGEQPYYPLSEAHVGGAKTFEEVTGYQGLDNPYSVSRLLARQFVGNPTVGYKMALCERDMAIYSAIFLFGIIFWATGRKMSQLHWAVWLFIGLGPIGLDGFSQLFSQFNWTWLATYLPYRESTPFLRVLTGALFGFLTAWFAYPGIEETMSETRQVYLKKLAVMKVAEE